MKTLYSFVEKYAELYDLEETLVALPYGMHMHEGQFRSGKDNKPYYCHPLKIAAHAISIGIREDAIIAAALLHDVCEDCKIHPDDLPVGERTREIVRLLTRDFEAERKAEENEEKYYENILNHKDAVIVKLLDRCNNVSEMAEGFNDIRLKRYIDKTEKWFYPMIDKAFLLYADYEKELFIIQYHMMSVMRAAKRIIQ